MHVFGQEPYRRGGTGEPSARVLLVDQDQGVAHRILDYLTARRYVVEWVDAGEKAFNLLDRGLFDVLITELSLRGGDGMRLMTVARDRNPDVCVIFLTEQADMELATEAMRQGAYDFQFKPVNLGKLEAVIKRGLDVQQLVYRQHELHRRLDEHYGLGSLVGNSRQMVRVYEAVRHAAPDNEPVMIEGEPGTGKDLLAQALHTNSLRRDGAFVKVQCAGGPPERVARELFGFATDAGASQPGRIEAADKGTLYLDNVNELTREQQAAVAAVMREGRYQRPGGRRPIAVNVRIVVSLVRPFDARQLDGDLMSLLQNSHHIEAPSLRERPEDIPLLIQHFLEVSARRHGLETPAITRHAMDILMRYQWPGNVRELGNLAEGMAVASKGTGTVDVFALPEYVRALARPASGEIRIPAGATMAEVERIVIEETMKRCRYNKNACAKTLQIGLRTLYRKLKEYDIQ